MADFDKLPVGTRCEVTYITGQNKRLLGTQVEIVKEGLADHSIFERTGYSYLLRVLPGFEDRWSRDEFYLYSYNLTPIPVQELTPEQLVSMRKELQHALQRLREES